MEIPPLTQTVTKGGCAAKLPAGQLSRVLGGLRLPRHLNLVVGAENFDDAALFEVGDGRYLIATLDFFTPIVDDPEDFGAIAATNALSDIYAMGGEPALALTILAFPTQTLPLEVLERCLSGACRQIAEAGACLAGGHSIEDDTLKLGFSVNGFVAKHRAWTNAGARPGDVLLLTKGLGTGTIATAIKNRKAEDSWAGAAIQSMKTLNTVPKLVQDETIHAATDITGFGLAGHLLQLARASGVACEVDLESLPQIPGAVASLEQGFLNRAHRTNQEYVANHVTYGPDTPKVLQQLTWDAQTSGGLLLSVPADRADAILEKIRPLFPLACAIGRVLPKDDPTSQVSVTFLK